MKKLYEAMILVALGALTVVSCNGKKEEPVQKPVVTESMYSVTANSETGEVVFKFNENSLSPYWTVVDPNGTKTTFTDREVVKTFEVNGDYNGSIAAFGQAGESEPVAFTFTIAIPKDPTLSDTEIFLMANNWKPYHYGYCADATVEWWDWEAGPVPGNSADDVLTFGKDGVFTLNLGDDKLVFNDEKGGKTDFAMTGNEKWAYVKDGDVEYIQFSNGGFPSMLGDNKGVNAKYEIRDTTENSFRLYYHQPEVAQYFYITFVPEDYVEPSMTEEKAMAALSGKTFYPSSYGWWGTGWEWFTNVEAQCADDTITFGDKGTLVLNLGETPQIYNDGIDGGKMDWTVTGKETWSVVTVDGTVVIRFANGGFPLMLAGAHVEASNPDFTLGLNADWTVTSIDSDGVVRLDIVQPFYEDQWMTIFLAPVE